MIISEQKKQEFAILFQEFLHCYPSTPDGLRHLSTYNEQRKQGKRNFETVINALENGENITDLVLLKLLPYTDTEDNKKRGAWIHIEPVLGKDIRISQNKFKIDRGLIAKELFTLISQIYKYPNSLAFRCNLFRNKIVKPLEENLWIHTEFLSPILNTLNPEAFLLINSKSIKVINYLTNNDDDQCCFDLDLIYYSSYNNNGFALISELKEVLEKANLPALRIEDIFDMFCHWLVVIKKFDFENVKAENKKSYFNHQTFELLKKLHDNQTKEFYEENKDEFKQYVENPFKTLFSYIASQLPLEITDLMETEKNLFSPKNYYIKNKTPDFIWGTFSVKNSQKIEDVQLFLFLNYETLEFGFYISQNESQERNKFIKFCQNNQDYIINLINQIYNFSNKIYLGSRDNYYLNENQEIVSINHITPEIWLNNIAQEDLHLAVIIPRQEVLNYSQLELINYIINMYQNLFSLVLITVYDDPIPKIEQYLNNLEKTEINNIPENIETETETKFINPEYTIENLCQNTYFKQEKIEPIIKAINRKKQIILQGSPGTGKTFLAQHLAKYLISNNDGFSELVQFHPSYSYEDFIQGIRPISNNGQLEYNMIKGRFLEFCQRAKKCEGICVLIIDEINRGNLASIFGELMYLLEYREQNIKLAGSNEDFSLPQNVRIIGTMNTADRSIALVDHALRRRFSFITLNSNYDILKAYHKGNNQLNIDSLIKVLKELNKTINDPHYELGISFFLTIELKENIEDIWLMEIEPYLEEYFFDSMDKVKDFSWKNIKQQLTIDH